MMGWVGSGEDFCGLGWIASRNFGLGLGFEKVTHAPASPSFLGPPIHVRTRHEKQQPNFAR